ncbi:MAG: fatty acid desaturase, partial [Tsuneonella sp.]
MPVPMNSLALDAAAQDRATGAPVPAAKIRLSGMADDKAMLRAAAELTRDLQTPSPRIYWTDFLGSAAVGYAALAGAILAPSLGWALASGVL